MTKLEYLGGPGVVDSWINVQIWEMQAYIGISKSVGNVQIWKYLKI